MTKSSKVSRLRVKRAPWLNRTVVVLTAVSLTQDAASELLYPLLPILLTTVLAAPAAVVGIIEGLAEAAAGVAKLIAGRLSDRLGRKPVTAFGYSLAAVGKIIVAAAGAWPMVLAGRVTDRLGKGTRGAARDAWLASSVDARYLGRAFGFHRMGDTIGAVIGPLLGLALLQASQGNVRQALWVAVIPAVASAALVLIAPEKRRRQLVSADDSVVEARSNEATTVVDASGASAQESNASSNSPLPRQFWRVAVILGGIALVNFPDALLMLRLHDLGWSTSQILIAYVAYNLVYSAATLPAGILTDRLPPARVYAIGLVFFGIAYLGLGTVAGDSHSWVTWALLAVYGLFPACTDGVGKAWISGLVPDASRGRAQGYFQAIGNGAVFAAGLWAGLAWSAGAGEGTMPLVASGILGFIGSALLLMVRRLPVVGQVDNHSLATSPRSHK